VQSIVSWRVAGNGRKWALVRLPDWTVGGRTERCAERNFNNSTLTSTPTTTYRPTDCTGLECSWSLLVTQWPLVTVVSSFHYFSVIVIAAEWFIRSLASFAAVSTGPAIRSALTRFRRCIFKVFIFRVQPILAYLTLFFGCLTFDKLPPFCKRSFT